MVDAHGNHRRDQPSIEHAFLTFYKDLWTTSNANTVNLFDDLLSNLPRISNSDAVSLTPEVTKKKIYITILDSPTGKSPGPDGFNAEFYHNFWPITGDQIYEALRFFFDNSFMPHLLGQNFHHPYPQEG